MVLLLDNYDSFTYNLAQYLGELGCNVEVHRNDKISVEEIARRKPEQIVISPGPCTPQDAGICIDLIRRLAGKFPILGVCLGHQAIGAAFGGKVVRAPKIFHGKTSQIHHRRNRRWHHHGRPPPPPQTGRRAIPSGVGANPIRQTTPPKLPRPLAASFRPLRYSAFSASLRYLLVFCAA